MYQPGLLLLSLSGPTAELSVHGLVVDLPDTILCIVPAKRTRKKCGGGVKYNTMTSAYIGRELSSFAGFRTGSGPSRPCH